MALKDLGFSLEEIGRLLDSDLSAEQMRGMLKLRKVEIRQRVQKEMERLERVDLWLRQIEQENFMSKYDVVIQKIEPIKVASVRRVVPTLPDQRSLWEELMEYLYQQSARMIGPPQAVYHDGEFKENDWDIEVCTPINEELAPEGNVKVHDLPGFEKMACVVHTGPFVTIGEAYDAVAKWIDQNRYQSVGPGRELNLRVPEPIGNQNDPNTANELQYPVKKI